MPTDKTAPNNPPTFVKLLPCLFNEAQSQVVTTEELGPGVNLALRLFKVHPALTLFFYHDWYLAERPSKF